MTPVCEFGPICLDFENKSRVRQGPARGRENVPHAADLPHPPGIRRYQGGGAGLCWNQPRPLQQLPMRSRVEFFWWEGGVCGFFSLPSLPTLLRAAYTEVGSFGCRAGRLWPFLAGWRLLHRMAGVRGPEESRDSAMTVEQDMFDAVVMADERWAEARLRPAPAAARRSPAVLGDTRLRHLRAATFSCPLIAAHTAVFMDLLMDMSGRPLWMPKVPGERLGGPVA